MSSCHEILVPLGIMMRQDPATLFYFILEGPKINFQAKGKQNFSNLVFSEKI